MRLSLLEHQYVESARPSADARIIASAVEAWIGETHGWVVIPAAAGRTYGRVGGWLAEVTGATRVGATHPDHSFVRDTILRALAGRDDLSVIAYEELPYASVGKPPERRLREAARAMGREAVPIMLAVDRVAKAARIRAYKSQLPHLTLGSRRVDDPASLPAYERYWLLPPGPEK